MKIKLLVALPIALTLSACNKPAEQASVSDVPPAVQPAVQSKTPWDGNEYVRAVFPDENATKSIPLDYESFAFIENNGLAAVPLPPFLKRGTVIRLMPHPAGYELSAGNDQCTDKIVVRAGEAILTTLDPRDPANRYQLFIDAKAHPEGQEIELWMDEGAQVNFNCVIKVIPAA